MEHTLLNGDRVVLNKLAYGPRIPITLLSASFLSKRLFLDWLQLPYLRFPGYSTVKNNDIIVFNFPLETELPVDERKEYIKRCIGIPSDTLKIKNGVVYINKTTLGEKQSTTFRYSLHSKEYFFPKYTADSFLLKKNPLMRKTIDSSDYNPAVFPNIGTIRWNADNFGPLYIPKKGSTILLNKENILLYQLIIETYENNSLKIKNDSIYINNKPANSYTFKMNYYFAMGDNRYHSNDSRFWGFVPENHIIGKVSFTLYSPQRKQQLFKTN